MPEAPRGEECRSLDSSEDSFTDSFKEEGDVGQDDEEEVETEDALGTPMSNEGAGKSQGLTQSDPHLNQNQGEPVTVRYYMDLLGESLTITVAQPLEEAEGNTVNTPFFCVRLS